jgi:hypothetical protein
MACFDVVAVHMIGASYDDHQCLMSINDTLRYANAVSSCFSMRRYQ